MLSEWRNRSVTTVFNLQYRRKGDEEEKGGGMREFVKAEAGAGQEAEDCFQRT